MFLTEDGAGRVILTALDMSKNTALKTMLCHDNLMKDVIYEKNEMKFGEREAKERKAKEERMEAAFYV